MDNKQKKKRKNGKWKMENGKQKLEEKEKPLEKERKTNKLHQHDKVLKEIKVVVDFNTFISILMFYFFFLSMLSILFFIYFFFLIRYWSTMKFWICIYIHNTYTHNTYTHNTCVSPLDDKWKSHERGGGGGEEILSFCVTINFSPSITFWENKKRKKKNAFRVHHFTCGTWLTD